MGPLKVSRSGENRLPSNHKGPERRGELTNEAAMKKHTVIRLKPRSKDTLCDKALSVGFTVTKQVTLAIDTSLDECGV